MQMFPVARLLDAQKQAFEVQAELDEQKRNHARLVGCVGTQAD